MRFSISSKARTMVASGLAAGAFITGIAAASPAQANNLTPIYNRSASATLTTIDSMGYENFVRAGSVDPYGIEFYTGVYQCEFWRPYGTTTWRKTAAGWTKTNGQTVEVKILTSC